MTENFQRIEQQYEGQEHQFLDYQHVDIHFIYSFTWNSNNKVSWKNLSEDLQSKGWKFPRLHDRAICDSNVHLVANYQPSLVSRRHVLEWSNTIQKHAKLILQTKADAPIITGAGHREVQFGLSYTVRIFENRVCICTFMGCLQKDPKDDNGAMFEKIHAVLRLARNIDYVSPERGNTENQVPPYLTDAYLLVPKEMSSDPDEDWSLYPKNTQYCTLHDLFKNLLKDPPPWAPQDASILWADKKDPLDRGDPTQAFQSPFIVTIAEVEMNSFLRFRKYPTLDSAREVASIMCKLTLDNRYIRKNYLHLSEDYIVETLHYNPARSGLINYCLDRRLFFSFSKRGAIAITSDLEALPACFVAPSFLNLLEIIMARWHMCCILNMQFDDLIDELDELQCKEESEVLGSNVIDSLVQLRQSYLRFLQDPIPYLFDGGSVTEIAKMAMVELGISELSETIHRKMQILDAIRQDLEDKERRHRKEQFDQEWPDVQSLLEDR